VYSKERLHDYLGTVGAGLQSWAGQNRAKIISFILAYREAPVWIFDVQNAQECRAILRNQFPDLTQADCKRAIFHT
jgi:hypothetical protein